MVAWRSFSSAAKLRSSTFFVCEHYNEKVRAGGKFVPAVFESELLKAVRHDATRKSFAKLLRFRDDSRLECLMGPIFSRYSQLKFEELPLSFDEKEKLYDPEYLPSRGELLAMFRLELAEKAYNFGLLPKTLDLSLTAKHTVYRDLIRYVCHLRDGAKRYPFPTALTHYCRMIQATCQPLTSDFVRNLAIELANRIREQGYSQSVPIIELGAGSGRLTHFLNATKLIPVPVVATDVAQGIWQFDPTHTGIQRFPINPEWRQRPSEPCFQSKNALAQRLDLKSPFRLRLLGVHEAIMELKPAIVLCSWMPSSQNWPLELARAGLSNPVREFIHIGELGQCVDRVRFNRFANARSTRWALASKLNLSTSDMDDDWGYSTCVNLLEHIAHPIEPQDHDLESG